MPVLLAAEEVSRSAELQVQRRDPEARAQLAELLDRREPAPRDGRQVAVFRHEEVGVGAAIRAAHASAELIELGQSEPVGAIDHERVHERNVEPVLHDRRADEDVGLVADELEHDLFELRLLHLAVSDDDARLGHEASEIGRERVDGAHAVVDEEDLPASSELVADGLGDDLGVEAGDVGLDRHPILGRRLDDREIPDARERHVEGARDRGGGERERVHAVPQLLEALLVGDAEPLLFVDDEQAEVFEHHVLRQEPVGADDDVDLPRGHVGHDLLLLRPRAEPRQHLDADGKRREALAEGVLVLEREDRRRHEHRDLHAVGDGFERRPHRDLGLPVADVAAQEAVHRRGRLHVRAHVLDRLELIARLLELEQRLELPHPLGVGREGVAAGPLARGIELEELLRHVAHGAPDALLDARPARAPELVEPGSGALRARVLLEEVELVDGDVELVAAVVLEHDELGGVSRLELLEPGEDADAVLGVNHEVADGEITEVGEEPAQLRAPMALRSRRLAEHVARGEDGERQLGDVDALRQVSALDHDVAVRAIVGRAARAQSRFGEELDRAVRHPLAGHEDAHVRAPRDVSADLGEELLESPSIGRKDRRRDVAVGLSEHAELLERQRPLLERLPESLEVHEELRRLGVAARVFRLGVALEHALPLELRGADHFGGLLGDEETVRPSRVEVLERARAELFVAGHPEAEPLRARPVVEVELVRVLLGYGPLARGEDAGEGQHAGGALRLGVEAPDLLDLVPEQLEPQGRLRPRAERGRRCRRGARSRRGSRRGLRDGSPTPRGAARARRARSSCRARAGARSA